MSEAAPDRDDSPLPRLAPRAADSHKGTYGRVLLVGGSRGMPGSISLSGMACLRSGAGLVRLAVPAACQSVVAGFNPCYMTVPLESDDDGLLTAKALPQLEPLVDEATVIACGPGLGQSPQVEQVVADLYQRIKQPAVFDADALNALARQPSILSQHGGPRVLTPHPGEFARLLGPNQHYTHDEREQVALRFAAEHRLVLVLKGSQTVVTDGARVYVNTTGNPGMATGGTGDVLTGVIGALIGQGLEPYDAARLGVYVHGLAGDLAAEQLGEVSLTAVDVVEALPAAFQRAAKLRSGSGGLGFISS